jgi:flavin reductase (DIM6/NTAB) family NADH-FMN oxidoreductase RutF
MENRILSLYSVSTLFIFNKKGNITMEKSKLGPQTLLYPMPAVLVGAMVGEKPNFMTAAWCVALQKIRHTLKGIKEHDTFSINVPSTTIAKQVDYCGIYSGKKRDKSELFNVFFGVLKTAPLIQECAVNLECQVIHTLDLKSHELVIGEIIETYVTKDCVTDEKPDPEKIDPLIYTPGVMQYQRLGEIVGKAFHMGKD